MNWHESDTDSFTPLPAKVYIAAKAAADTIEEWLMRDCEADDSELCREVLEWDERGWLEPAVEA